MARDWPAPVSRLTRWDCGAALILALVILLFLVVSHLAAIRSLDFGDGDDALRLVQVRDWLAGQGWFDTTQHRINPPTGGLMHWSRLIDVQIGGLILLLRPILGTQQAEIWALALYPPLLLAPLFLLIAGIARRLTGDARMVGTALILAATTVTFLHYFVPLRIDHHNWQAILSAALLMLALGPPSIRSGVLAGLVMSLHLAISLEALPYLLIFGGLFALHWLRDPDVAAPRFQGFLASVALAAPMTLLATRGLDGVLTPWCDAWSAPFMLATAAAALTCLGAAAILPVRQSLPARMLVLLLAGGVGVWIFLMQGRACLAGPFGALEPLVRTYWYDNVLEGRPVTRQMPAQIILLTTPSLAGLAATIWQWRAAPAGPQRARWGDMALVLGASFILSLLVTRTTAVTHIYALAGLAAVAVQLWTRARACGALLPRILLSLMVVLAVPPVMGQGILWLARPFLVPTKAAMVPPCPHPQDFAPLNNYRPTLIFSAIDIGPMVLAHSPHAVIATGHHRNHAAMNRVIGSLAASPDMARDSVRRTGATLLFLCPNAHEIRNIAKRRPDSLAAALLADRPPDWLVAQPMPPGSAARLYQIRRQGQESKLAGN